MLILLWLIYAGVDEVDFLSPATKSRLWRQCELDFSSWENEVLPVYQLEETIFFGDDMQRFSDLWIQAGSCVGMLVHLSFADWLFSVYLLGLMILCADAPYSLRVVLLSCIGLVLLILVRKT